MQKKKPLNREYTQEELEQKRPKKPKINIDDYKPSGNLYKGIKTKDGRKINYIEPNDAKLPTESWRFYCFKGDEEIEHPFVMNNRSFYIFGTDKENVDIVLRHPTNEPQHAVVQFRYHNNEILPYIIDLNSKEGVYLNKNRIKENVYIELRNGDVLMFGHSTREYVLLKEKPFHHTHLHSK
ncbi:FHA domain containing protein, putative [Entamoeba histolytica HM-1:IMSS-B]|uniref:FHA domain protein, putative n=5 Tax=Entamoeba histolytica TaxID=5759 RepID=C4M4X2_ENTH1|nr:FHA domain protein, putative [Entamoeba histolytica HM-1:IMSS]EMD43282.1 FHA domain containing protein [Entamoeba histolytica KU27]EMH74991.1 FHA domain containing protein, putative [Entamoeba histolytica HM-1:IMSS-B]ENY60288.1 FHA domain containing protein [Entamoeba histolytica HM-1:IMSS-A]GAT96435.1 fha domain protein putative [Entamoeba histolytica]EAL47266.1 FHA domain protein, putative [Entamoeba histolytica HM-1:IMSS]|eukprot:XP_652652.1 FHA domain protein, putative [Entamoeba histolytica HM-1:IMSS]